MKQAHLQNRRNDAANDQPVVDVGESTVTRAILAAIVTVVIGMLCTLMVAREALFKHRAEVRIDTVRSLAAVRGAAEVAINKRVYLTLGLKAHVSVNPDITAQEFADLAALAESV